MTAEHADPRRGKVAGEISDQPGPIAGRMEVPHHLVAGRPLIRGAQRLEPVPGRRRRAEDVGDGLRDRVPAYAVAALESREVHARLCHKRRADRGKLRPLRLETERVLIFQQADEEMVLPRVSDKRITGELHLRRKACEQPTVGGSHLGRGRDARGEFPDHLPPQPARLIVENSAQDRQGRGGAQDVLP